MSNPNRDPSPATIETAKKAYREQRANSPMKLRETVIGVFLFAIIMFRLIENPSTATLLYAAVSAIASFDSDVVHTINHDGEVESEVFTHKFIQIDQSYSGTPVNVTYHYVECGDANAEPILFFHGLGETWKVWKEVMKPFCKTHRAIAFDSEGMGQSVWPSLEKEIPHTNLRTFYADVQMQAIDQLGINRYNIVNFDYSFWSLLTLLKDYGDDRIIRYGKFQSTAGVEDIERIPQAQFFKYAPGFMDLLFNSNPYALTRILYGKPLVKWPGLYNNSRVGVTAIPDDVVHDVLLTEVAPDCFKPWVWGYHYGLLMAPQMELQLETFRKADYPVTMLQGALDKGQPRFLFDGTATMEIVEQPMGSSIKERITRHNTTHHIMTTYSSDGSVIGPKAEDFFPNSPWVKFKFVEHSGHFLHLEAHDAVVESLEELLSVPDPKAHLPWYK